MKWNRYSALAKSPVSLPRSLSSRRRGAGIQYPAASSGLLGRPVKASTSAQPGDDTMTLEGWQCREPVSFHRTPLSRPDFDRFESLMDVVAGLVPATSNLKAQSKYNRGGRDKPGHDRDR